MPVPAPAAEYTLDTTHSQAEFVVTHLAISKVRGQIPVASGSMATGANDVPTAITVTLDAKRINSQSADRDRELRGSDWLDVVRYPTITFVSKRIDGTPQAFTVAGDLTPHGVTKPVTLTGSLLGTLTDARGRKHIGYTAATTIDRREWGLSGNMAGGSLVAAYDVAVDLNVEAVTAPVR